MADLNVGPHDATGAPVHDPECDPYDFMEEYELRSLEATIASPDASLDWWRAYSRMLLREVRELRAHLWAKHGCPVGEQVDHPNPYRQGHPS